jgi:hypothetical protein
MAAMIGWYPRIMVAVAWTAIGLLAATLLGTLYYLGGRMDALAARLDGRIDALSGRIDALAARLEGRIDSLSTKLDTHIERHAG